MASVTVKSRSHLEVLHTDTLTNVTNQYQLPTPYTFRDIPWTRFYRSGLIRQSQGSNQGHAMMLHTYNS